MSQITTGSVRTWVTLGMTLVLAASLAAWFFQRDTLPRHVQIATGPREGLYYKLGDTLSDLLEHRIEESVEVLETGGSEENFRLLVSGTADLAIVQGGAVPIEEVSVVTPLFREFVFVIVRKGTHIRSVWELAGQNVWLGQEGSGNRDAALKVLRHYGIEEGDLGGSSIQSLTAIPSDESIDAAIITAGIEHPYLRHLLSTGQFDLVPLQSAPAMELVHPFLRSVEVPRGLFSEHPSIPSEPVPTVATTAYLVCRGDTPGDLVEAALAAIHEESLRLKVPTLIARQEAPQWTATRMHSTAQRYFNPEDSIGEMVRVMESLVATKELLFALGAGIYLAWMQWRRLKEKELRSVVLRQKAHLDRLLMETLRIERSQVQNRDLGQLQSQLESVTRIKLQALQELTEEELRGNQEFSIFLAQCSSLISRIQLEILAQQSTREKLSVPD